MIVRKVGGAAIIAYFGLFYFLPVALMWPFGPHVNLKYDAEALLVATIVVFVFFLAFLFAKTGIRLPMAWARRLPNVFRYKLLLLLIVSVSLPVSVRFYNEFGAGFRYSGIGVASGGFVPQYMSLYKGFFFAYTLYWFVSILRGCAIDRSSRALLFVGAVVWGFSANGSADVIWLTVAVLVAVFGLKGRPYFVSNSAGRRTTMRDAVRGMLLVTLMLLSAFGVVLFGLANKSGLSDALNSFNTENLFFIGYYLYYRISMFVVAIETTISYGIDWQFYGRSIDVLSEMIGYRLRSLAGLDVVKPDLGGINQLNYFEVYRAPANTRSGASPGVIASFLYLPILPLNLVASAIYVAAIMNTYDRAAPLKSTERPTVFTMFFMIFASFALLHSPLEAFLKIGPELFATVLMLYALEKARHTEVRPEFAVAQPALSLVVAAQSDNT